MKTYSLSEVFAAAGRPTAGISVKWDSTQMINRKGDWQDFDQFTWANGFSTVVITLGKGVQCPKDGDEVYLYCQKVITNEGTYTNYVVANQAPSIELSLEDFAKGNTPDIWEKTSSDEDSDED